MKGIAPGVAGSILLLTLAGSGRGATEQAPLPGFVCGVDISAPENFYHIDNLKNHISLLQNDGSNQAAYQAILDIYLRRLQKARQLNLPPVRKFLILLEEIVSGLTSAEIEMSSRGSTAIVSSSDGVSVTIPCAEFDEAGNALLRDMANIVESVRYIDYAGWYGLSRSVDRKIKMRSIRYDQWLKNGIRVWPHEAVTQINQRLLGGKSIYRDDEDLWYENFQFGLLRPTIGFTINDPFEREEDSTKDLGLALGLEIFGIYTYGSRDFSTHRGVSLIAVASEDRNSLRGIQYRQNGFVLGLLRDQNDLDALFFGVDLLNLFNGEQNYVRRIRIDSAAE